MWTLDIDGSAHNIELKRTLYLKEIRKPKRYKDPKRDEWNQIYGIRLDKFYTVCESWITLEGEQENTEDIELHSFPKWQDGADFIAHLVLRLNNPFQNILLDAAKGIAIEIIDEIPKRRAQFRAEQKRQNRIR